MANKDYFELLLENFDFSSKQLREELHQLQTLCALLPLTDQYRLLYSFYVTAKGRNYSVPIIRKFVLASFLATLSSAFNIKSLFGFASEYLDNTLEEDSQLPSIQRFFPEFFRKLKPSEQLKSYQGTTAKLLASIKESSIIARALIFLSRLAGIIEEDLDEYLGELAYLINTTDLSKQYEVTKSALKQGDVTKLQNIPMQIIITRVNQKHILATREKYELPNLKQMSKRDAQNLHKLAERYDIYRQLEKQLTISDKQWRSVVADIEDVFKDFQQSSLREKWLALFKKRVFRYGNIGSVGE